MVDSSPRPIAASHVLHRLLVPRHPPFALDNLTTENKMLASTVQFSTNDQPTTINTSHQPSQRLRYEKPDCAWHWKNNPHPQVRPSQRSAAAPAQPARVVVLSDTQQGAILCALTSRILPLLSLPAGAEAPSWPYSREEPLPVRTSQCLRLRAPRSGIRRPRATGSVSRSSCSLERR